MANDDEADGRELTQKQERFCIEYTRDGNATRAAIAAGYSPKTAQEQGSRLLSKVIVKSRIKTMTEHLFKDVTIEKSELMLALKRILLFDIRKLWDSEGRRIPINELPAEVALAIESVEVLEVFESIGRGNRMKIGETRVVRAVSKINAIRIAAQILGLLKPDPHELTPSTSLRELLTGAKAAVPPALPAPTPPARSTGA